jgi:hypothetical protein
MLKEKTFLLVGQFSAKQLRFLQPSRACSTSDQHVAAEDQSEDLMLTNQSSWLTLNFVVTFTDGCLC